jgi:predicted methyltransferase
MTTLTQLAHEAVSKVLQSGDIAIDFTAGNGWDTLFLARCVGSTGHVYAFDIQSAAIQSTHQLLTQHAVRSCVTLEQVSHAQGLDRIPYEHRTRIQAGMMNLGYLPSGDKSITTQTSSTLVAIRCLLDWLQPSGLLSILAYTGHAGGQAEADGVRALLAKLDSKAYAVTQVPAEPTSKAPILFTVRKQDVASSNGENRTLFQA